MLKQIVFEIWFKTPIPLVLFEALGGLFLCGVVKMFAYINNKFFK